MSIQDVRAIHNPQRAYMWEVQINALSTRSIDNLSFYAKTISLPQQAVEQMIINHKDSRTHHAGRDASAHTVNITFWDDENLTIVNFFHDWMDLMRDPVIGGGVNRDLSSADLIIRLKDVTDQTVTAEFKLTLAFPIDVAEIPLSYDVSDPIELSVTMSYDARVKS